MRLAFFVFLLLFAILLFTRVNVVLGTVGGKPRKVGGWKVGRANKGGSNYTVGKLRAKSWFHRRIVLFLIRISLVLFFGVRFSVFGLRCCKLCVSAGLLIIPDVIAKYFINIPTLYTK